jgi:hypothetical protein
MGAWQTSQEYPYFRAKAGMAAANRASIKTARKKINIFFMSGSCFNTQS